LKQVLQLVQQIQPIFEKICQAIATFTMTIANALIHCLKYLDEAKTMGECARQFILENYTWDKIAVNLIQKYQSILDC